MVRKRFFLRGGDGPEEVTVEAGGGTEYRVGVKGGLQTIDVRKLSDGRVSLLFPDGRQLSGRGVQRGNRVEVVTSRCAARVTLTDPLHERLASSAAGSDSENRHEEIRTLMPGRVVQVCVRPGERVDAGALLLVLEAMKMQNEIRAPIAGGVEDVLVADGQSVEAGAMLLSIRS